MFSTAAPSPSSLSPPSTPTKPSSKSSKSNNNKSQQLPKFRRSRRVLDRDPIIAPGYGTRKDLVQLSEQLGLPYESIEVVMKARGRGLRSQAANEEEPSSQGSAASTAWADFMSAEGVGNDNKNEASTAQDNTKKRKARGSGKTKDDNNNDTKPSADGVRSYILPAAWDAITVRSTGKKASKKAKSSASASASFLLQAGTLDTKLVGRTKIKASDSAAHLYHCPVPTRLLGGIHITQIFTGCNAVHSLAVADTGAVYAWGRNESHQLGLPKPADTDAALPKNVYYPTPIELPGASMLQTAALGKSHTMIVLQDQSLYAVGANKAGQCSVKTFSEVVPHWRKCSVVADNDDLCWAKLACGEDFTMALSTSGHIYSCGCSQYGQLGTGETGEYFVSANRLDYANANALERRSVFCHAPGERLHATNDTSAKVVPLPESESILIQDVACGKHHTLLVEASSSSNTQERPRVFSFGCGDYGCLGHGVQKDDYYPRSVGLVAQLPMPHDVGLTVSAGAHCSLLQTSHGHVYYWGKHKLSGSGNAVMRPQLVDALANNQHVAVTAQAGGQTVLCSTSLGQTVAWGQGGHGELGLGEKKSSAKPTFVEALNGIQVLDCAAGYGHSLFLVQDDEDDDTKQKKSEEESSPLDRLPKVELEDVEGVLSG